MKSTAQKSEAEESPATFDYRGLIFEIPAPLDLPLELLEAEDELTAVKLIVGDKQWAAYKATGPTIREFGEFADLVAKASGQGDSGN
ncbi:hypothetical protein [Streptomyces sp. G1]|uniref:hypothetical protein n=1 Tax=Streptomyces sp. G1 TaxID=361572 RepID=UPI0020309EC1|nr:hypothetical protein [Streptomyces sp. G1]MCM1967794.1 hypothetical protein [Streptomyces sp. G1]